MKLRALGISLLILSGCQPGSKIEDKFLGDPNSQKASPGLFSFTLPFLSPADYSLSDPAQVEVAGGVARLKAADQRDSAANTGPATGGFQSAVARNGVQWDAATAALRLSATTNTAEMNPSWAPQWANLVGYWKMNGDWSDSSGHGRTSTVLNGSPQFQTSTVKVGSGASSFSESTFDLVDLNLGGQSLSQFTLSIWVNPNLVDSSIRRIFMCNNFLIRDQGNGDVIFGALYGSFAYVLKAAQLTPHKWMHLAGTFDGSQINFFVNGVSVGTTAVSGPSNLTACNLSNPGERWDGMLDEAAIWSAPLTPEQVKVLYDRQSAKYSGELVSRVFDAGSTQPWGSLSYQASLPSLKELPGSGQSEASASYPALVGSGGSTTDDNLMSSALSLWHFNETTLGTVGGADFADATGNGNSARAVGGATLGASARFFRGVDLDGSSGYLNSINQITAPAVLTEAIWFRSSSKVGGYLMGFGDTQGLFSTSYDRHLYMTDAGNIVFGVDSTAKVAAASPGTYNDGAWHLAVGVLAPSGITLYLDGKAVASNSAGGTAPTYLGYWRFGLDLICGSTWPSKPTGCYFSGSLDEAAVWNRALHPREIEQLYRRGGNRVKFQVRACTNADCSDQDALTTTNLGWAGPGASAFAYFSELYNTANNAPGAAVQTASPVMDYSKLFSAPQLSALAKRYFQYRAILESDDENTLCSYDGGSTQVACSPELKSVGLGPDHFSTAVQSITSLASAGQAFTALDTNGFSEVGGACTGGLRYSLSADGTTFYYWSGSAWVPSTNYSTASDAATVSAHIASFPSSPAGTGVLQLRTYLRSDGSSSCQVDALSVTGAN